MTEEIENLVLEHLKKIQAEQTAARARDREMMTRLSQIESAVARIGRDIAHGYEERIEDRHALDALRERVERIERRLEISEQP
jgi:Trk K+ transport system NAD-binding subunit